jgi:hypothetical protein
MCRRTFVKEIRVVVSLPRAHDRLFLFNIASLCNLIGCTFSFWCRKSYYIRLSSTGISMRTLIVFT